MNELATYTFLPWVRDGIANQISGQSGSRATIPVELTVKGDKTDGNGQETAIISKDIQIYGPGDITGIDSKSIIKAEPRNWITNFEPNYLPYIEFYDEDFPWRYSPMPNPGAHRLKPWLALVVLKESEFADGKNVQDKPLPFIELTDEAKLHPAGQLWAWAHVHVNRDLLAETEFESTDGAAIGKKLADLIADSPDLAYSRIVCPRKLEPEEGYHAFLVPAFESGRLAGLGQSPEAVDFDEPAWDHNSIPVGHGLPYYHRWFFRTGTLGDFEYLVRLLKPRPVDSRVGLRDMDVQTPGANLLGLRDEPGATAEEKLNGILKLGGALKLPDIYYSPSEFDEVEKYRNWAADYPHPFQENIASFLNLTDGYDIEPADTVNANSGIEQSAEATDPITEYDINNNPDPLITAPLYGRWHALTSRLLKERDGTGINPNENWIHELNLDPRWRVAAGFGTKVVQENQEDYMKAAWDQIGDVLEANKKIRQAQLSKFVAEIWYEKHLKPIKEKQVGKWLSLTSPVQNRVISQGLTVFHQKKESQLTLAATAVNMRKVMRPGGKIAKRLTFTNDIRPDNIITRINEGEVTAAPPKVTPEGIQTPKDIADEVRPDNAPDFILDWLKKYAWIKWIFLIIAVVVFLLLVIFRPSAAIMSIGGTIILACVYLYNLFNNWLKKDAAADAILEENQTPESVDELPNSPDFRITLPADNFIPQVGGSTDSEEAQRFKVALRDVNVVIQESAVLGEVKPRPRLDLEAVNQAVFVNINPAFTIPRWVLNGIKYPLFVLVNLQETFVEAMAYPKIDLPMYKPLVDYSSELFLPNINFIANNSISILETNQKFIEAYMVGLNHEFARELLWREYLTDQRGSYFRQFWDVSGYRDTGIVALAPIKARFEKILDERLEPELEEHYKKLQALQEPLSPKGKRTLRRAHREILKEELKDIKPLHHWSKFTDLGDHDNREAEGDNEEEVVLVIRGELLKKYPTAVIYAHKAVWNYKKNDDDEFILDEDGQKIIDLKQERSLMDIPENQEGNPPASIVKSPLYEAKVKPDIYFFGFDLTVCEAKGGTGKESEAVDERCADVVDWDDAGWFFVIKERPGEPRFGLDVPDPEIGLNEVKIWNDLSWSHVTPAVGEGDFLQITNATQTVDLKPLVAVDLEKEEQREEDDNLSWNKNMNAAQLAYILYQVPVLVAVHASEMLPDK